MSKQEYTGNARAQMKAGKWSGQVAKTTGRIYKTWVKTRKGKTRITLRNVTNNKTQQRFVCVRARVRVMFIVWVISPHKLQLCVCNQGRGGLGLWVQGMMGVVDYFSGRIVVRLIVQVFQQSARILDRWRLWQKTPNHCKMLCYLTVISHVVKFYLYCNIYITDKLNVPISNIMQQ